MKCSEAAANSPPRFEVEPLSLKSLRKLLRRLTEDLKKKRQAPAVKGGTCSSLTGIGVTTPSLTKANRGRTSSLMEPNAFFTSAFDPLVL